MNAERPSGFPLIMNSSAEWIIRKSKSEPKGGGTLTKFSTGEPVSPGGGTELESSANPQTGKSALPDTTEAEFTVQNESTLMDRNLLLKYPSSIKLELTGRGVRYEDGAC